MKTCSFPSTTLSALRARVRENIIRMAHCKKRARMFTTLQPTVFVAFECWFAVYARLFHWIFTPAVDQNSVSAVAAAAVIDERAAAFAC